MTTGIGPGTTAAAVVYSGTCVPAPPVNAIDFNGAARTILGSGLAFTPGTYYLDRKIEQRLEHAVVHPMRHRIQLERLLSA